jgi:hypothetical protein
MYDTSHLLSSFFIKKKKKEKNNVLIAQVKKRLGFGYINLNILNL